MLWIAPSEKDTATETLEKRLRDSAVQFRLKKFEVRSPRCEVESVRRSKFVVRHCPGPHDATGCFDFVLANPAFNVNAVDRERLRDSVGPGRRFPLGLPRTDHANYLWIQLFRSALNEEGRAGFVMAKSASDATRLRPGHPPATPFLTAYAFGFHPRRQIPTTF